MRNPLRFTTTTIPQNKEGRAFAEEIPRSIKITISQMRYPYNKINLPPSLPPRIKPNPLNQTHWGCHAPRI